MRKYINVFLLFTLVFALLPFFMTGKDGKPLMDLSKKAAPTLWTPSVKTNPDSTSAPASPSNAPSNLPSNSIKAPDNLVFYKWQDKNGSWQYSNIKPSNQNVIEVAISPNTNILQALKNEMDSDKAKHEADAKSLGGSIEGKQHRALDAVLLR